MSPGKFDSNMQLTKAEFRFFPLGTLVVIRWSKTIQFRERVVEIPLPCIPRSKNALPPLFFMPSVLHLLPLTVKPSIGLKPPPQNRGFLLIINFSANLGIILLS